MNSDAKDCAANDANKRAIIADTITRSVVPLHSTGASTAANRVPRPPKRRFAWLPRLFKANPRLIDLSLSSATATAPEQRATMSGRLVRHLWPGARMLLLKTSVTCAVVYATKRSHVWDHAEQTSARWQPLVQWSEVDRELTSACNAAVKYSFRKLQELPHIGGHLVTASQEFGHLLLLSLYELKRRMVQN